MATATEHVSRGSRARGSGLVFGEGIDRGRLFRRARLHSYIVRSLRIGLPLTALAMCAYYAVALRLAMGIGGVTLPTMPVITADNLKMDNPRYEGFTKDGGKFLVTARTAEQDFRDRKAPVKLTTIDGRLLQPDQTVTDLKATRGTFDNNQNQLELYDGIDIVSQSGMKAKLSRATIFTKEHRIVSVEPVAVDMPQASVRSRQMVIEQKSKQVFFTHGVAARMTQERKPTASPAAAAAPTARAFGSGDGPVDVTADRLEIDDAAKVAAFKGGVRATQGEALIETEELQIGYEGSAAGGMPGAARAAAASPDGATSRLQRLVSPVPVVLTQGADRMTGDRAEFDAVAEVARIVGRVVMTSGTDRRAVADRAELDQRHDTILLTGPVHVTQSRNEIKGRRLWIDRKSGRAQLTSPGDLGGNGRIWTRLYQGDGGGSPAGAKKSAVKAAQPADAAAGVGFASFKTDPNAPIDIEAGSLDINDTAKTAVYRGDVRVVQGEFKMQTAEMTAFYAGQTGMNLTSAASKDGQAKPQAQLTKIEARKSVAITTRDGQTANGDWADFDVKSNQVILGGDVKLTQGQTVVRGSKLIFDMTTGESRIFMDQHVARGALEPMPTFVPVKRPTQAVTPPLFPSAEPAVPAGAPAGTVPGQQGPFTPETTGRPRMVLHPQQFKGFLKKDGKDDKPAAPATGGGASGATPSTADTAATPRKRRSDPVDDPTSVFGNTSRN